MNISVGNSMSIEVLISTFPSEYRLSRKVYMLTFSLFLIAGRKLKREVAEIMCVSSMS